MIHSPAELMKTGKPVTLSGVADGAEGLVVADIARAVAAGRDAPAVSLLVVCRDGQRLAALAERAEQDKVKALLSGEADANDTYLEIHAGAGGVGSAAIQLCKAFGNPCWVSVGSADRLAYCESLGAQGGALRGENLDSLKDFAPFDVILDPVGASYAALNLNLIALDGRWVVIAMMGGRRAELDLAKLLAKRVQITGSTLRNRDDAFKAALIAELREQVWPLFADKQLSPQLERTFRADQAEEAFALLESNQVNGKIVLVLDDSLA